MDIVKGSTPNGGVYAHVYFLDNEHKASDKENGTNGYIVEFDSNGKRIMETRFIIKGKYIPKVNSLKKENKPEEGVS